MEAAVKPRRLKRGDTIGVIAPASSTTYEKIEKALGFFRERGFTVKPGRALFQKYGYLAGTDEERARDINEMFEDPEVTAIFCMRGGYGTPRLLDLIDYSVIRKNPKIFVGYSDITALHTAIFKFTGLVTFHGPMAASDLIYEDCSSEAMLWRTLTNTRELGKIPCEPQQSRLFQSGGRVEGRLLGGNLSMLASLLGTPYEVDTRESILYLEDIGEEPYKIDRMLMQLKLSGKLEDAAGFILCDWNNCEAKEPEDSLALKEVLFNMLIPLKKPVVWGYKIGHCTPNITIPNGVRAVIDGVTNSFVITESAVL